MGLFSFVGSAVLAIAINYPFRYEEVLPDKLREEIMSRWQDSASTAEKMTATTRLKVFKGARKINNRKANLLLWSVALQGLGVAAIAVTSGLILFPDLT